MKLSTLTLSLIILVSDLLILIQMSILVADESSGSWFAWANSVFAQTILDIAGRKPHLLFGKGAEPYVLG